MSIVLCEVFLLIIVMCYVVIMIVQLIPVKGCDTSVRCLCVGRFGGLQAAMQLRCLLSELGTLPVSSMFAIPEIDKSIDENGRPLKDGLENGLDQMIIQLDWHARSMKNHRDNFGHP